MEEKTLFSQSTDRLSEFKNLEDGWNGNGSKSFDDEDLDWLISKFKDHFENLPKQYVPYVYPCVDEDTISFEWGGGDISLHIDLKSHVGEVNYLQDSLEKCFSEKVELNTSEQWENLLTDIKREIVIV